MTNLYPVRKKAPLASLKLRRSGPLGGVKKYRARVGSNAPPELSNGVYALIMAGGKGTRLWPKSKGSRPKQILCFNGDYSILQNTFARLEGFLPRENILVITNRKQAAPIKRQLPFLRKENLVIEPEGKNTLPCMLLGAILVRRRNHNAIIAVLPADHLIKPARNFAAVVRKAAKFAHENDALMTIGIKPDYPATGYGYIKIAAGNKQQAASFSDGIYKVKKFFEKPSLEKAKKFFRKKNFFWNGGIFIAKASKFLEEIKKFMPAMYEKFACLENINSGIKFNSALNQIYKNAPSVSIDYAILEKSKDIFMIRANFLWADVGSWESLLEVFNKDKNNNFKNGENILRQVENSIIINEQKNHLICAIGLNGVTVVHTPKVTLIQKKSNSQQLKKVVACLERDRRFKKYV